MSSAWKNVANALQANLATDATLLTLTGHSSTAPSISTAFPDAKSPKKFLSIQLFSSRPLTENATQIKVMLIDFQAFCTKKIHSIEIADRIEYLFDNEAGGNAGYYNFSDSAIKVMDSRFALKLPEFFYEDFDRYSEGVRVRVVVDPYSPCP